MLLILMRLKARNDVSVLHLKQTDAVKVEQGC